MIEAAYWEQQPDGSIRCQLCRHHCRIPAGGRGHCNVRLHQDGRLWTLTYGNLVAEHIDPIEKKPIYHLHPGSRCYSVAAAGCTFRCSFCQNHQIAMVDAEDLPCGPVVPPPEIVEKACAAGCRSLAATYTEPTLLIEYLTELFPQAKRAGLATVLVTNGYMADRPLSDLAPFVDAANIDLKSFRDRFYREECGARLDAVLEGIRAFHRAGIWIELTTLFIPDHNDSDEEMADIATFIARELGPEVPWHVSAFYPAHRMLHVPPTPESTIERAVKAGAKAGLHFVYPGNVSPRRSVSTSCPACGNLLIERSGYRIERVALAGGSCPRCRSRLPGIWGGERNLAC